MKHKIIITALSVFIIAAAANHILSNDGKMIGKILSVNSANKEIIISHLNGESVEMGAKVYVRVDLNIVIMTTVFPMMTSSKCKPVKESAKFMNKIETGMSVYRYDKSVLKIKEDDPADPENGGVKIFGDMEMIKIPGSTFNMGSPVDEEGRSNDEKLHPVTISSFLIGKYEVTQNQYQALIGTNPSMFEGDKLPVESLNWYDAIEFCNKLSIKNGLKPYYRIDKNKHDPNNKNSEDNLKYTVKISGGTGFRLPTEAEWEYACRAGTTSAFHYGETIDGTMANFNGNNSYNWKKGLYRGKTTEAGSFLPNAYGLHDMHGNVDELCWDWYDEGYYEKSTAKDPKGSISGEDRVVRGGSWYFNSYYQRSARRGRVYPDSVVSNIGFRVVRSLQ